MITKFRSSSLFFVLTVFAMLLAACSPATSAPAALPNTGPTAAPATQAPVILISNHVMLGNLLTDSKGMTLYIYKKDTPGVSNCSGQCSANWPPLVVPQGTTPTAISGVTGTLGTIQRSDGTTQVTVNNQPVYTWMKDKVPGDVKGQGVGKVWFVLDAGGSVINTLLPTPTASAAQGPVILVAQSAALGNILTDSKGMTIYAFTQDAPGKSNCSGDCAGIWPPVTVPQGTTPAAGSGFSGTLGTIQRSDGTIQVTVNNMPVYTWVKDKNPGDTTGQNVGKVWFVLDQTGNLVKTVPAAPAAAPAAASQGATIMVADTANQGKVLTDGKGITLYLFTKDSPGVTTCYDKCAAAWPPLTVPQGVTPTAGSGFTGKLGTIQRTDGSLQVTINNLPVYYFAKDQKPGDAMGQGIGQVWFVIDATGNMMNK